MKTHLKGRLNTRLNAVVSIAILAGLCASPLAATDARPPAAPAAFTPDATPPSVVWADREPLSERMTAEDQDPPAEAPTPLPTPPPAPRAKKPRAPGAEAPESEEPSRPAPPRSLLNVKVDVTFSEQRGSQTPVTKTVSLTVGDGEKGSVRSLSRRSVPSGIVVAPLNVDARPSVEKQRIRLSLSIQYHVIEDVPDSKNTPPVAELGQSLVVVLESGKSMLVTQSADPLSDRKVTLEVKATILP